jgi:hypothetical protein
MPHKPCVEGDGVKVDAHYIGGHLAALTWVAARSFLGTLLLLSLAGAVLAGLAWWWLHDYHWAYGTIAAALALAECVATGIILGTKRAVVMTLAHGLGSLLLGRALVRLVFERMLGIAAGTEFGTRGGRVSQGLERLPLAQADELLSGAVRSLTGDAAKTGWLRRTIQARLLEAVRRYTLGRFRQEGAKYGGIDLMKLKDELEQTVDDALVRKVCSGLWLWTALVILGLPLVVAAQTWLMLALLARGS